MSRLVIRRLENRHLIGPLLQASGGFDYIGLVTARTEARPPGTVAAVRALHR